MGLSKSKHKPRKGEEQKGRVYSGPKAKERPTGRHSQESEKPPDTKPAESLHGKRGAAKRQWPSSEVEAAPKGLKYKSMRLTEMVSEMCCELERGSPRASHRTPHSSSISDQPWEPPSCTSSPAEPSETTAPDSIQL